MEDLQLLVELHRPAERQGPGGEAETRLAAQLAGLDCSRRLRIADIGCGTGASTLLLASELDAEITAVDFLQPFLDELQAGAERRGVAHRIATRACSMDALPFGDEEFDVIWSEGAVYNMGFAAGIADWRRFLKPGGVLVVSEITWFTAERPTELQTHWEQEYPEIGTASEKMAVLERQGYRPKAYFMLPVHCWMENYYRPMQERFPGFLREHQESEAARELVAAEAEEIDLYERYHRYYGYGFYIAEKTEDHSFS